jgi:plasmid stabilization system protein ParE
VYDIRWKKQAINDLIKIGQHIAKTIEILRVKHTARQWPSA